MSLCHYPHILLPLGLIYVKGGVVERRITVTRAKLFAYENWGGDLE